MVSSLFFCFYDFIFFVSVFYLSGKRQQVRCSTFLLLSFREDDLIDREVDHHLHAAVNDGDQDVVQCRRKELLAQRHINTHQKAAGDGDKHKGHHIPCDLIPYIALGLKGYIALHREIDTLGQKQGDGKGRKISHAAGGISRHRVVEHIRIHRS